jgi:hypothetical protein
LREHKRRNDDNPAGMPGANDHHAQLVAAAEALRAWVRERRETWPDPPGVTPVVQAAPRQVAEAAPMFATFSRMEPPVVQDARPADIAATSRSMEVLRAWLLRWGWRVAVAVAVVAVLATAGLKVRERWAAAAATPKIGTVVLESVPPDSDLFIDGTAVGKTPLTTELTAGRHVVEFRRRNSSRKLNIDVAAGRSTSERLDWTAKRKGSLEVLSDPAGASISVDGTPRGVTPMTIDDLSAGPHTVDLESGSGSVTRQVEIRPDRVAQVTEALYSGWLHVSSPIELQISEGSRRLQLDDRNQILLPPGAHELQFDNARFGYRERRSVDIKPGAIVSIAVIPMPSRLTVTASLPAEVLVDERRAGETPLTDHAIDLGTRVVVVKSITGAERRFTITATVAPVSLVVDFSKP